jgi:hypothetical protein
MLKNHPCVNSRALALSSPATDENVALVERFLSFETDDWNLGGIIYALCSYWKLTGNYIDFLMELTKQDNWEDYSDSIIRAFPEIGMYCYNYNNHEIIRKLVNRLIDDCQSIDENLYCQIALGAVDYAIDYPRSRFRRKDYTAEEKSKLITTAIAIVERSNS